MGQKVNPLGFRLSVTQRYATHWYAKPAQYAQLVTQDYQIREHIYKNFFSSGISQIEIHRILYQTQVRIWIYAKNTNVFVNDELENPFEPMDKLWKQINKIIQQSNQDVNPFPSIKNLLYIRIRQIPEQVSDSKVFADWVVDQLNQRKRFRQVLRNTLQHGRKIGLNGIKVQISGRLNGAEIARSAWARKGRIPLHTLRANISYSQGSARTIYGILGVKVWTYTK